MVSGGEQRDSFRIYIGEFIGPTDELDIRSEGKKEESRMEL